MNPSNDKSAGVSQQKSTDDVAQLLPLPAATVEASTVSLPVAPKISDTSKSVSTKSGLDPSIGFEVAEDKDVIEPEWTNKAKAIVAQSRDDPYKQSDDLTVFKADYMQKRYNKTIKLK